MPKLYKQKLAVFDIDGTIFRSSLAVELIHTLVDQGIFPKAASQELETDYQAWLNREGSYNKYLSQLITVFMKYLPGKKESEIQKVSTEILETQRGHVYRYTRNLVHECRQKKFHLVAVSGSPYFLVSKFADSLGFNASFGSEFVVKDKVFTGGVLHIGDTDKLKTLQDYVTKNNLNIDWKGSYAVGDTTSDMSLLSAVGKPIAFNPNTELAAMALKKHWTIIVERKDVVYNFTKTKLIQV